MHPSHAFFSIFFGPGTSPHHPPFSNFGTSKPLKAQRPHWDCTRMPYHGPPLCQPFVGYPTLPLLHPQLASRNREEEASLFDSSWHWNCGYTSNKIHNIGNCTLIYHANIHGFIFMSTKCRNPNYIQLYDNYDMLWRSTTSLLCGSTTVINSWHGCAKPQRFLQSVWIHRQPVLWFHASVKLTAIEFHSAVFCDRWVHAELSVQEEGRQAAGDQTLK